MVLSWLWVRSGVRRRAQLHVVLAAGVVAAQAAAESLADPEIAAQPAAVLCIEQRLGLAARRILHRDGGAEAAESVASPAEAPGDVAVRLRGSGLHPRAGVMLVLDVDGDRPLA